MTDCRTCKHYSVKTSNKNENFIIQMKCCLTGAGLMMSSLDCPEYKKIGDEETE